ncbi:O-antigen ligase family protein [Kocuria rosea]|uniref:O-antigen ligase family protein n=1 Tax=Kocuria rosea TaxID=1275 RepID=UPI00253F8EE8|nr:O-antigen ligase family protein [Kocuria rosea]WIG16362.1 O-antigen ligase family protein [Kocuria rosea]
MNEILGVAILMISFVYMVRNGAGAGTFTIIVACLALSNAIAVFGSAPDAFGELIRTASVLSVFFFVKSFQSIFTVSHVVWIMHIVCILSMAFTVFQLLTSSGMIVEGVPRIAGAMAHPNSAALLYALGLTLATAFFLNGYHRVVNMLLILAYASGILLTGSLGGIAAALVMIMVLGLRSRRLSVAARLGAVSGIAIMIVIFFNTPVGRERLSQLSGFDLAARSAESNSLEWRIGRWSELLFYWYESPFVGQGYGSSTTGSFLNGYVPHSEYVRILVEGGLVGTCVLLLAVVSVFRGLIRVEKLNIRASIVGSAGIAMVSGLLVNATAENTFLYSVPGYLLALVLGLGWGHLRAFNLQTHPTVMARSA